MELGRSGRDIEIGGGKGSAYRAIPASRSGRGVLVIQASAGSDGHVRDICDRLAREGFVALAPRLSPGESALDLDPAVRELLSCDATEGSRVGVLGVACGAELSLRLAAENRRIGAVALCDRPEPGSISELDSIEVPVLAVFPGPGDATSPEDLDELAQKLTSIGRKVEILTHVGAKRGFLDDSRPDVHDPVAAAAAWKALLTFLRAEL